MSDQRKQRDLKRAALAFVVFCLVCLAIAVAGAARADAGIIETANAVAPEVPTCPNALGGVVPIVVEPGVLPENVLGQVDYERWGPCAFAIVSGQDPYAACVVVFHEREHLIRGNGEHDAAGLMRAEYDPGYLFPPCAALVPVTLYPSDAYEAVLARPRYKTVEDFNCRRRGPAALRCIAYTARGRRLVLDVWRDSGRRVQIADLTRRRR